MSPQSLDPLEHIASFRASLESMEERLHAHTEQTLVRERQYEERQHDHFERVGATLWAQLDEKCSKIELVSRTSAQQSVDSMCGTLRLELERKIAALDQGRDEELGNLFEQEQARVDGLVEVQVLRLMELMDMREAKVVAQTSADLGALRAQVEDLRMALPEANVPTDCTPDAVAALQRAVDDTFKVSAETRRRVDALAADCKNDFADLASNCDASLQREHEYLLQLQSAISEVRRSCAPSDVCDHMTEVCKQNTCLQESINVCLQSQSDSASKMKDVCKQNFVQTQAAIADVEQRLGVVLTSLCERQEGFDAVLNRFSQELAEAKSAALEARQHADLKHDSQAVELRRLLQETEDRIGAVLHGTVAGLSAKLVDVQNESLAQLVAVRKFSQASIDELDSRFEEKLLDQSSTADRERTEGAAAILRQVHDAQLDVRSDIAKVFQLGVEAKYAATAALRELCSTTNQRDSKQVEAEHYAEEVSSSRSTSTSGTEHSQAGDADFGRVSAKSAGATSEDESACEESTPTCSTCVATGDGGGDDGEAKSWGIRPSKLDPEGDPEFDDEASFVEGPLSRSSC